MNKSKTTIYYHFRKIKGRTVQPISKLEKNDNELLGEFIGLFAGDGSCSKTAVYQYRTYLCFNITEKEYVKDLINSVLMPLFKKRPMAYRQENRLYIFYYSKFLHALIRRYLCWNENFRKTYSVRLKNTNHSIEFMVGFIRGNLDSDGHVSKNKISFASVSPLLIKNITFFLKKLGMPYSLRLYLEKRINRKNIYHITIPKTYHALFWQRIKPRNKKGLMHRPGFEVPNAQSSSVSRTIGLEGRDPTVRLPVH